MGVKLVEFRARLKLDRIAGGFPGHIDSYTAYLQSPRLSKSVPERARREFIEQFEEWGLSSSDEAGPPPTTTRTGFAKDENGRPHIFAHYIKAMLQQAAEALYDTKSRPSIYQVPTAIKRCLEVTPEAIPIEGGMGIKEPFKIAQIIKHPRNPNIRVPSLRERELWVGGTVEIGLHVIDSARGRVLLDCLEDLLIASSMFIGLGTDRGYEHGRFEVESFVKVREYELKVGDPLPQRVWNPDRKGIGYVRKRSQVNEGTEGQA